MVNSLILFRKLRNNLSLRREQLDQIRLQKLQALIRHSYETVDYYRDLFDSAGLKPEDIRTIKDVQHIPITDKAHIRPMDMTYKTSKNVDLDKCIKVLTSGSTGMPTYIYTTYEDYLILDLIYLRSFLENGLRFRDKRAFVLDPHSFDTKKNWYHKLGLATYTNISCFAEPQEQLEELRKVKPHFIHGYPSSLAQLAKLMLEKNIKDIRPRVISTSAELLHKKDRELINSAFGAELYDRYAARECGNIAWECDEHNGYHINIDSVVLEFVKDGKLVETGKRGEAVVTNLHSYAMPFIRYKIGDIGIPSDRKCTCGSELPLMESVEGRDEDFIVLGSGKAISPMMITGTLDYIPGISQFKVIQENINDVNVVLAKGKDYKHDALEQAKKELADIFGNGVNITCHAVEEIPRETNGKVRAVISKVQAVN